MEQEKLVIRVVLGAAQHQRQAGISSVRRQPSEVLWDAVFIVPFDEGIAGDDPVQVCGKHVVDVFEIHTRWPVGGRRQRPVMNMEAKPPVLCCIGIPPAQASEQP